MARYVKEEITITVAGKERVVTPCSQQHRDYFEAGYIVLTCKKCGFPQLVEAD